MSSPANWFAGWTLLLLAFASGAILGLFFHRDEFLGGYASWRRRMIRLGHIALAALGMLNLIYAIAPINVTALATWSSRLLIVGGVTMPLICGLSAFFPRARHVFVVPVTALILAVAFILLGSIQ